MQFDYYAATLPVSPALARDTLLKGFDIVTVQEGKPRNGYQMAQEFHIRSVGVVTLSWGGHNPHPFAHASGQPSAPLADLLRSKIDGHTCARVDVYSDTEGGREEFDSVSASLVTLARSRGLASRLITSPTEPEKGRTLYLGSRTSEVAFRYYEKDREQRDKGLVVPALLRNRAEFEVKPKNRARKARLASLPPSDVPGFARWSAEAALFWSSAPELTRREAERKSKARASIDHMKGQYRNALVQLLREEGAKAFRSEFLEFARDLELEAKRSA